MRRFITCSVLRGSRLGMSGRCVLVSDGVHEPLFLASFLYSQVEHTVIVDLEELR